MDHQMLLEAYIRYTLQGRRLCMSCPLCPSTGGCVWFRLVLLKIRGPSRSAVATVAATAPETPGQEWISVRWAGPSTPEVEWGALSAVCDMCHTNHFTVVGQSLLSKCFGRILVEFQFSTFGLTSILTWAIRNWTSSTRRISYSWWVFTICI